MTPHFLESALSALPPAMVFAMTVGSTNSALLFLLLGRRISRLIPCLLLGAMGGAVGQWGAAFLPPLPLLMGETNVLAATVAAWLSLLVARSLGLW